MRIPLPQQKRRARIEIIPLIDIVFFLLATFVMISLSMVKNQGISVNLPTATTSKAQEPKSVITISINNEEEIFVDKQKYDIEGLSAYLKSKRTAEDDLRVLINGDEKASFGRAIAVLDTVRQLGITKVSIRTKNVSNH